MSKASTLAKLFTWSLFISVLVIVWLFPLVGLADNNSTEVMSPASEFLILLMKLVFTILGILATWATTKVIGYFEKKTKIDIPEHYENLIFGWADMGIGLAHEKARQHAAKFGTKLDGSSKSSIALGFVNDLIKKYNLDVMAQEKLKDYVDAKLGLKRMEGDVEEESEY